MECYSAMAFLLYCEQKATMRKA